MVVIIHLAFLGAVASSPSIPSLELEAFLHGGKPYEALVVSQLYSVDDIAYRHALEHLKQVQDYRFLMELGFNRIEIGGRDTIIAFKTNIAPSDQVVRESVGKLRTALLTAGCDSSVIPLNLIHQIMEFSPVPPNRKLHRIDQITFLVERFDAFKRRFESDDNVNGYVNHDQTRTEQLDTVFRILYGRKRPDDIFLEDFNLAKINLNLAEIDPSEWGGTDVSRKVTIPYHIAPNMLLFSIINAARRRDGKYFYKLRSLVEQLMKKYYAQVQEYSAFMGKDAPTPPIRSGNLMEDIRAVQTLRRQALDIYESFKLSFPSVENRVFSIYLHDPEERGLRFYKPNAVAFNDRRRATVFVNQKVIPSFKEVPEFLYRSLRDVVVFRNGPVHGSTLDTGRAIALFDDDCSLERMIYTVRHECGHVFHHSIGFHQVRSEFFAVSRANGGLGLPYRLHYVLSRAHDLLEPPHPLTPIAYADYRDAVYVDDKMTLMAVIEELRNVRNYPPANEQELQLRQDISRLSDFELFTLITEYERLQDAVNLYEEIRMRFFGTFLGSNDDHVGSSSFYGMRNINEDVAELLQQLASNVFREALFQRTKSDSILHQKVDILMDKFDRQLVHEWFQNSEGNKLAHPEPPVTVIIVSEIGKESMDVIKSANSYVAQQIKRNRDVSFPSLEISPHGDIGLRVLLQSNMAYTTKPYIVFFQESSEGYLPTLEETLNHLELGSDGRRVYCVRVIM